MCINGIPPAAITIHLLPGATAAAQAMQTWSSLLSHMPFGPHHWTPSQSLPFHPHQFGITSIALATYTRRMNWVCWNSFLLSCPSIWPRSTFCGKKAWIVTFAYYYANNEEICPVEQKFIINSRLVANAFFLPIFFRWGLAHAQRILSTQRCIVNKCKCMLFIIATFT